MLKNLAKKAARRLTGVNYFDLLQSQEKYPTRDTESLPSAAVKPSFEKRSSKPFPT